MGPSIHTAGFSAESTEEVKVNGKPFEKGGLFNRRLNRFSKPLEEREVGLWKRNKMF
jgi:hypothetical protein